MKQAGVSVSLLFIIILFFLDRFPFFFSSSLPLAVYLLLSALQSSLSSSSLLSTFLSSQFSFPFKFFTPPSNFLPPQHLSIFSLFSFHSLLPPPSLFPHLCPTYTPESSYKLTSSPSTGPPQKCPLGWDQSAPGLTLA